MNDQMLNNHPADASSLDAKQMRQLVCQMVDLLVDRMQKEDGTKAIHCDTPPTLLEQHCLAIGRPLVLTLWLYPGGHSVPPP